MAETKHMRLFHKKSAAIWLFGLTITSIFWVFVWSGAGSSGFSRLNTLVFDSYQQLKPRQWGGTDIVIIDIDEASIKRLGQWPWPRTILAKLTDRLGELGAAAIVFDIVFSEPDRTSPLRALDELKKAGALVELPNKVTMLDNDNVLAESFARNVTIAGMILTDSGSVSPPPPKAGTGLVGSHPARLMRYDVKATRNLPQLETAATGIGNFGFSTESQADAVIRKSVLIRPANDQFYPSLAMETLRVVQGAGGFKIKNSDGSGEINSGEPAVVSVQVGALEIPTDADGALNIYHSLATAKPTFSARSILYPKENGVDPQKIARGVANHIVLIGTSAAGLLDLRASPLHSAVPGVTIHAEIIDQIITGTYLSRPDISQGVELSVAIVAVLLLLLMLPFLNPLGNATTAIGLVALVVGGFWFTFAEHRLLFSPIIPFISLSLAYAAGVAANLLVTENQGRFIRNAFTHYLSPTMVERLANNPETLELGGEEKELTLLFCDIRGFTGLSEGLAPTELTDLLNNFLTPMTTVLLERGATIDKYMGDAIMAFWNAPIDQEDHTQRACEGMLAMRAALKELNTTLSRPISIGIGLNTGPCCVGNLGSNQRFSYSAIGDAVNVASRIEGLTKHYGLDNLVADETLQSATGFATLEVDRVGVVGRDKALTVHTIVSNAAFVQTETFANLQNHHRNMLNAYRDGDIEKAASAHAKAKSQLNNIAEHSLHGLYRLYDDRIEGLRKNGVPEDWDGVYRATEK